jgi:hypothetical protein
MTVLGFHIVTAAMCALALATARKRNWPWVWHRKLRRETGEVYMDRWQLLKLRFFCLFVNRINMPDYDPLPHNHPWRRAYSLKLRGSYREDLPWPTERGRKLGLVVGHVPGRLSRIPEVHRIAFLRGGRPVWTLFIGLGRKRPWGFVELDGTVIPKAVRKAQRGVEDES